MQCRFLNLILKYIMLKFEINLMRKHRWMWWVSSGNYSKPLSYWYMKFNPKYCFLKLLKNLNQFYYLPPRQRPGKGDIETPPVCPSKGLAREILKCPRSVRPSVRPSVRQSLMCCFRSVTHYCISSKLCRYVHHVMVVCCIYTLFLVL